MYAEYQVSKVPAQLFIHIRARFYLQGIKLHVILNRLRQHVLNQADGVFPAAKDFLEKFSMGASFMFYHNDQNIKAVSRTGKRQKREVLPCNTFQPGAYIVIKSLYLLGNRFFLVAEL